MTFFTSQSKNYRKDTGFTLLELMIALSLIAIISLIALPNFRSLRDDQSLFSEANKVKSDLRYMQQVAFDTQNSCIMTYVNRSYDIRLSSSPSSLKNESLENNIVFQNSGTISMGRDGIPTGATFPVTITLTKNNAKVEVKIYSGGKIDVL